MRMWVRDASRLAISASCLAIAQMGAAQNVPARPTLEQPALSADGRRIAFSSGGGIWEVAATGGDAHLLINDGGDDQRPLYSPDGKRLAFTSTRGGSDNIYVLDLATGDVTRMTWSDAPEELDAWSSDGKWIYFSSGADDIANKTDVMRISAAGGTPVTVSGERYLPEFQAAPSPAGTNVALMARGLSNIQWWRNGHSHIDETELWLKDLGKGEYHQILADSVKHAWPMWTPEGRSIVYMSDASGTENLWQIALTPGAVPEQLTHFSDGRLLYPTMAADGSSIVFGRDFGIWEYDMRMHSTGPVAITLRGMAAASGLVHKRLDEFQEIAVSPDGKKIALVGRGALFAARAETGAVAQRLTTGGGAIHFPVWSPDSRRVLYVAEHGLDRLLDEYDISSGKVTELTHKGTAASPVYSPDGTSAVYLLGQDELHLIELQRANRPARDRIVFKGALIAATWSRVEPVWSPDGRYVAFPVVDRRSFENVYVAPVAGGSARPVSFLANGDVNGISWSPDGKFILMSTGQRSEDARIVRIDLTPHVPKYREEEFRSLFKPGTPPGGPKPSNTKTQARNGAADAAAPDIQKGDAAKADARSVNALDPTDLKKVEPVEIDWENLRARATILPLGMNADSPVISGDGKTLIFRASERDRDNLYSYSLDELATDPPVAQQISATAGLKGEFGLSGDDKTLFYLDNGKVFTTQLDAPKPKVLDIDAELDVGFAREKQVVFDEASSLLDQHFYDSRFNGKDWSALRARFEPYVEGARTPDELRRIINLMIGELNASHSGIYRPRKGPGSLPTEKIGRLGLYFEGNADVGESGLVVREVVALGPAAVAGVRVGDRLVSVDGTRIGPHMNLGSLLADKVGKRLVLGIAAPDRSARDVVLKPVSQGTESGLLYRQWVESRRALVNRLSGGRLGYVHLQDMSAVALSQLYIDLDADNEAKQGVVVDIRGNNGGFVNGYALDVFARRNFLTLTPRGLFPLPGRQLLGQRALGLPTVLVTNEASLSDAEDFTEGYRALGLGKVVGEPTAGWIIYTDDVSLIDGSVLRVPQTRVQGAEGDDMEMRPRPVDFSVQRPLGDTAAGRDTQLSAAVQVLLGNLPDRTATSGAKLATGAK